MHLCVTGVISTRKSLAKVLYCRWWSLKRINFSYIFYLVFLQLFIVLCLAVRSNNYMVCTCLWKLIGRNHLCRWLSIFSSKFLIVLAAAYIGQTPYQKSYSNSLDMHSPWATKHIHSHHLWVHSRGSWYDHWISWTYSVPFFAGEGWLLFWYTSSLLSI